MRQLAVISGKGGTGKTVLTACFASLAKNKVMIDCDVDAADLHLILHPEIRERHEFRSGKTAEINQENCIKCGQCKEICRFDAIAGEYYVDPVLCEGCNFCSYICPVKAIEMKENLSGEWFVSETEFGPLVHAKLGIAEENSGKLVSKIRQKASELAIEKKLDYVIIDGPPGVGCPVIASLSGVESVLVVTEPTLSGLHDAGRVIEVANHFNVPAKLVINKFDLNPSMTEQIESFCHEKNIPVVGRIRFDKIVVESMVAGKTIVDFTDGPIADEIRNIWHSFSA